MFSATIAGKSLKEPRTKAEYQAAIFAMREEMKRANGRMAERQIEADRLRAETRAMIEDLTRFLAS